MRIEMQTSEDAKSYENLINYLPVIIIEHAVLNNVQLILESDDQAYTLNNFVIASDRHAPLEVHGAGKFKGHDFEINGYLGPLADIYIQDSPYPVSLTASWQQAQLSINGTIEDPDDGEGMDLVGEIEIPEIADIFAKNMPLKGRLHSKFYIKGDLDELALAEIQASIANKELLNLQVTGSIGNLLTQEQTELHLSGFAHDAGFLKWLMPDNSPHFHSLKIDADINTGQDEYILQNLKINLSNKQLKIDLTGNTRIVQQAQPFRSLELQAEISSRDTVTVKPYLGNILPEMGPVKGSVRITTPGKDLILRNIDLLAGVEKEIQLTAKSGLGYLSMDWHGNISQIALDLALKAKHSSELTSFLEIEHPEIGPVAITASLKGSSEKIMLEDIGLKAGNKDVYLIQADGRISLILILRSN
ncbi:hypothetical protein BMR02_10775 [Methylococcaceae bacterium HT1]|nr:hypothetical protein BMR02_10775 [Methylococcaceae bacterium HT1]